MAAMSCSSSVSVGVETLLENKIQEISRDGQEIYSPQLSMSETLAELAHKIDFLESSEGQQETQTQDSAEEKTLATFQPSLWPWDSVRTKLRTMLTEVCVLSDILNIINDSSEKKYLVLDTVSQGAASPKTANTLVAKKQSLQCVSEILLQGAKRMSSAVEEREGHKKDFHSELMRVRQRWRMKRTASTITGDLTYKSAGSQFWHPGLFEVKKATVDDQTKPDSRALEVSVSSDLKGVCDIEVTVSPPYHTADQWHDDAKTQRSGPGVDHQFMVAPWQEQLSQAQRNLFKKELFAQLCHEACHNQGPITPFEVIENQIKAEIFPGTFLHIAFHRHTEDKEQKTDKMSSSPLRSPHFQSLSFILKSLLRRQHHSKSLVSTPRPVTAVPVPGRNKRQCLAGARALRLSEVSPAQNSEPLLGKFVKIAKHMVLRQRVLDVIVELSSEKQDPSVFCQWSSICFETSCSGTMHVTSHTKYSSLTRTSFMLKVGVDEVKAVCADGSTIRLSSEASTIKAFIHDQMCVHHIDTAVEIAQNLGWTVEHHTHHTAAGQLLNTGTAKGLLIRSPRGDRHVSLRVSAERGVDARVQQPRHQDDSQVKPLDKQWAHVCSVFSPVDWERMSGQTFNDKFSMLLGSLS